jgi:predicted Fe-Mo cluster-binding NifX family protein
VDGPDVNLELSNLCASIALVDAAMYSSGTPSTTSIVTAPRINKALEGAVSRSMVEQPGVWQALDVKICVPITPDGAVDPRWGRAQRVAVADVVGGEVHDWQEFQVGWGILHDEGTEGAHHARVATFLRDNGIETVGVEHLGPGMHRMLETMGIRIVTDITGDARKAAAGLG